MDSCLCRNDDLRKLPVTWYFCEGRNPENYHNMWIDRFFLTGTDFKFLLYKKFMRALFRRPFFVVRPQGGDGLQLTVAVNREKKTDLSC